MPSQGTRSGLHLAACTLISNETQNAYATREAEWKLPSRRRRTVVVLPDIRHLLLFEVGSYSESNWSRARGLRGKASERSVIAAYHDMLYAYIVLIAKAGKRSRLLIVLRSA
jgi:hypothetical protein